MSDNTVCTIGNVVGMLAMRSLLTAACIDPSVLYRIDISLLRALTILVDIALTRALAVWYSLEKRYMTPADVLVVAIASFLLLNDLKRGTVEIGGALKFCRDIKLRGVRRRRKGVREGIGKGHMVILVVVT